MFKKLGLTGFSFFCAAVLIFFSCKKTTEPKQQEEKPEIKQEPWSVEVISITKLNLNKINVKITITTDTSVVYDDWGVVYSKSPVNSYSQSDVKISSKGLLRGNLIATTTCIIDSLQGSTDYYIKAFVKKAGNVFFSSEKKISISPLKILQSENSKDRFYAERGERLQWKLNYADNNASVIETKVFIGSLEVPVIDEHEQLISFKVPEDISSGKKTIKIERNGLSLAIVDTLDILRGKYVHFSNFPYKYRSAFGWTQIGNTGYLLGGWEQAMSGPYGWHSELLKYDIPSNKWSTDAAPFPKEFVGGLTFTVNGKIYALSGRDFYATAPSNQMYEYDPSTNEWSYKSTFPGGFRVASKGFVLNNKIYVLGGSTQSILSDLWQYDPGTNGWIRKSDFPGTSVMEPAIFSNNAQAFVFGGYNRTFTSGEFWQYDALNDEWTELETGGLVKKRFNANYFTMGSKGYLLTGCDFMAGAGGYVIIPVGDSWELDLLTKKWTRISGNPIGIVLPSGFALEYWKTASFVSGNKAIICDGGQLIEFVPE